MSDDKKIVPRQQNLNELREITIERLKTAFSENHLTIDSYESRVSEAENAADVAVLANLVADLPVQEVPAAPPASAAISCNMSTKELAGSVLSARRLDIVASMSSVTMDYLKTPPPQGVQEIKVNLKMSTLVLRLPDDVVVENHLDETMATFKEHRNRYYDPRNPRTVIRINGSSTMSTIKVKRKRYWFFQKKKGS